LFWKNIAQMIWAQFHPRYTQISPKYVIPRFWQHFTFKFPNFEQ
jgi:hypothetical protein